MVSIQEPREPPTDLRTVAVGCQLNSADGTHVAFLYEREDRSIWFCDLAWDLKCRNAPVELDDFCWVNINLRPENLEYLAASLEEKMDQNAATIIYDVRYSGIHQYFDQNTWAFQPEKGLTCATFILAVLRNAQFELLDVTNWPARTEDEPALNLLIRALERSGVDAVRIGEMRSNHHNIRFRPEEVCASVSFSKWPVPFEAAEAGGREVDAHVRNRPSRPLTIASS